MRKKTVSAQPTEPEPTPAQKLADEYRRNLDSFNEKYQRLCHEHGLWHVGHPYLADGRIVVAVSVAPLPTVQ